jgi:hypothetical protein
MELLLDGRRALLEGLVDYAGVFPPASLSLADAVGGYRDGRTSPNSWMLGRFLCRTSQIEELASLLSASMADGEAPWSIGAIFDEPPGVAALHAGVFDRYMDPAAKVTAVELRAPAEATDGRSTGAATETLRPVVVAAGSVSPEAMPFVELVRGPAWDHGVRAAVDAIGALRTQLVRPLGAKLRTGGLTADAFPSPGEAAAFIEACVSAGIPFKATAGLHHPVRHRDAALGVDRHGFLNLLVATAVAVDGAEQGTIEAAIAETDPGAFVTGPAGLRWRDRRLGTALLRTMRRDRFPAYGSCSFDEPVQDLAAMGIIDA